MKRIISILLLLALTGTACADITSNLIGRYTCDDAVGTDSSGNARTMVWQSSPSVVAGKIGTALSFNGSTQRGQTAMPFATTTTIAAWIKIGAYPAHQAMIAGYSANTEPSNEFSTALGINSTGHVIGYAFDGGVKIATGSTVLSTGTWYHTAATLVNSGNIIVYVNGVSDGSVGVGTQYSTWSSGPTIKAAGTTGGTGTGAFENFLNAQLDDLRVYSRTLSPTDVAQLYAYPPGGGNGTRGGFQNGLRGGFQNSFFKQPLKVEREFALSP